MQRSDFTEAQIKHFWRRVQGTDNTAECWPFLGYTTDEGYGMLTIRSISDQPLYAHRVAFVLHYGELADNEHALHRCDNPPCCNPFCLFKGDQVINNADRHAKGRTASGDNNGARTMPERNPFVRDSGSGLKGAAHPMAKLSKQDRVVLRTRAHNGAKRQDLADDYGISLRQVFRIINSSSD